MPRDFTVTYGTYTIGGTSGPNPISRLNVETRYGTVDVSVDFVVSGANYAAAQAAWSAAEAALKLPRQRLTVAFASTTWMDLDPTAGASGNTGFNAETSLTPVEWDGNSALAQAFRFTARVMRPAVLTGQDGRAREDVTLHYDVQQRRVVTLAGAYTALGANNARAQYDAEIEAHANTALADIDPAATWALADEDARADDADKVLEYRRVYVECINGRRGSATDVRWSANGIATVTVTGTYHKVGASSAKTLYDANETAHGAAVMGALGIVNYETRDERITPNEQDETLTFSRVYQELLHQQESGIYDAAEIVADQINLTLVRQPTRGGVLVPNVGAGAGGGDGGGAGARISSTPGGGTRVSGQDTDPDGVAGAGVNRDAAAAGLRPRQFVMAQVEYRCFLKRTVTDPRARWESSLRAHLRTLVATKLGLVAVSLMDERVTVDPVNNMLMAHVVIRGLSGDLVAYERNDAIVDDLGKRLTPILGTPHRYLRQEGIPQRTRTISTRAVFRSGGAITLEMLRAGELPGWELVRPARPRYARVIEGVDGQEQVDLTEVELTEGYLYVGGGLVEEQALPIAEQGGGGRVATFSGLGRNPDLTGAGTKYSGGGVAGP